MSDSTADEIAKLAELRQSGIITARDFKRKKRQLIAAEPNNRRPPWRTAAIAGTAAAAIAGAVVAATLTGSSSHPASTATTGPAQLENAAATASQAQAAVKWAVGHIGENYDSGLCLTFVFQAWSTAGVNLRSFVTVPINGDTYPIDIWSHFNTGTMGGGDNPPTGALVFYANKAGDRTLSHVTLSLGNGTEVSTSDALGGVVHYETITRHSYAHYLGWWLPSGTAPNPARSNPAPSQAGPTLSVGSANSSPGQLQGGSTPLQGSGPTLQGGTSTLQGGSPALQGGGSPRSGTISVGGTHPSSQPAHTSTPSPTPASPSPASPNPVVQLAQGPAAPAGYRYAVTLTGFPASTSVSVECYDSVSPGGFYNFSLPTSSSGAAYTASECYSGDGPDHWVVADGVTSNHVTWGSSSPPPTPATTSPPTTAPPPQTWSETTGGVAHTWTDYSDAGGTEGPSIPSNTTVQIACKVQGFRVADGNTWWYRIASSPWNSAYYVSADAFYNNGQTSGSLQGTPFVDNNVANC